MGQDRMEGQDKRRNGEEGQIIYKVLAFLLQWRIQRGHKGPATPPFLLISLDMIFYIDSFKFFKPIEHSIK